MSIKIKFYLKVLQFLSAGGTWKARCRADLNALASKCVELSWRVNPEELDSLDVSLHKGGKAAFQGPEEKFAIAALRDLSPDTNDMAGDVLDQVMNASGVTGHSFAIWAREIKRHKKGKGGYIVLHVSDIDAFGRFVGSAPGRGNLKSGKVIF